VKRTCVSIILGLLVLCLGPGVWAAEPELAARVNGVGITQERLDKIFNVYMQQRQIDVQESKSPEQYKQLQRQVLDVLISQELLWQEAQKKQLIASAEDVDREMKRVRDRFPSKEAFLQKLEAGGFTEARYAEDVKQRLSARHLVQTEVASGITVSDPEVHDFYTSNQAQFVRPEEVHVRHILIKVADNTDQAAQEAARQHIRDILTEARSGADFAALAEKHSEGPSGPKGGDLGFVPRGRLEPPFEKAAFALKPGEISDVVQTRFGFHVIKMEARRGGESVPETEVADRIRQYLFSTRVHEAIRVRVKSLWDAGQVEILLPQ
jgi:peptidyl-prolyl cis-trans isomerase C